MNISLINEELSITTARLQFTLMTESDRALFTMLQADEQLMQYIGSVLRAEQLEEKFQQRVKPWQGEENHWLTGIVRETSTNDFIGSIGFRFTDIAAQQVEIGYVMRPNYQGKGYTQEIALALLDYLFKQINVTKIVAHCAADNIPSWKIMEKLGMKREGYFEKHSKINNQWFDELAYGMINPDA
ncbi:GNAT family N-acetyltransferase [Colwelliaceae bacterium 6441]